MTFYSTFFNKHSIHYRFIAIEMFLVSITVLSVLLFFAADSSVSSFENRFSNILESVILVPLVETLIFFFFLPYLLYISDIDRFFLIVICAFSFSISHSPDVPLFYFFYFVLGWYMSVLATQGGFKRKAIFKSGALVFFVHALWNGLIILVYILATKLSIEI